MESKESEEREPNNQRRSRQTSQVSFWQQCCTCIFGRTQNETQSEEKEIVMKQFDKLTFEEAKTEETKITDLPSPASSVSGSETERDGSEVDDLPESSTSQPDVIRTSDRITSGTFSDQFNTQDDGVKWKGMMKIHYVDKKSRNKCKGCSKSFGMKRRARHCRRCGELFCIRCLQYRRRLNKLAYPDPEGKSRKVCQTCYNEDTQVLGHIRSWTNEFMKERNLYKCERILNQRVNSKTQTFWRDQLDVSTECRRLLDGFETNVGKSASKKTMQELRSVMAVPDWQKSKFWQVENVSSNCRQCKRSLGLRKSKRNCKVCSLALCKKCSNKELLIYYEDKSQNGPKRARIALINVVGCPEKEPNISLLLRVCVECKTYIHEKQIVNQAWYDSLKDDSSLGEINSMNIMFVALTSKITASLQRLEGDQDTVDGHGNKKCDELALLGISLDEFHTLFKKLQKVLEKAETKSQHTFIKNYTKGKYDFYMESQHEYRKLCKEGKQQS